MPKKSTSIDHLAQLADLKISSKVHSPLQQEFSSTLDYVDQIQKLATTNIQPTHQVSHLSNVFRQDVIDPHQILTQQQALQNAPRSHQGYFVVDAVIDE